MTDVSVILVNYNTKDLAKDCINSVYEKTSGIDFDIWVVDNASADGTCEMIEKEFPKVKLIKSNENLGFGMGNNLAIEKSDAKYVFLLNTDTILINNAIKVMFDFMEKKPNAGACGGNLYDKNDRHVHSYRHLPTIKGKIVKTFFLKPFFSKEKTEINDKGNNENNEFKQVGYITGADLMMRKSVLEKIGGFDKDFFLYFEETELQFRIRKASFEIYILPDAKIYHLEGKSAKNRTKRREIFLKSEYLYYKKCYGISKHSPLKLVFMISHLIRLLVSPKMVLNAWKFILEN